MTAIQEQATEIEPLVSPADPKRVLEVMRRFEEFKKEVLKPTDYVILETAREKRPYIKKSGWMKYALACQLSLEKRDERVEEKEGSKIYHYTYRAVAPNGRFADAVGSAASTERTFTHPDHDVRALAQTRACNRAISNLVAGGEVSAEEMIPVEVTETQSTGQAETVTGTKPETSIPTQRTENTWKVPLIKDQLPADLSKKGIRQYPLLRGLQSYGMVNYFEDQIAIVPERPVDQKSPPINWFIHGTLQRTGVIVPICEKYKLNWKLELDPQGLLKAIVLFGQVLDEKQLQELVQGANWAFKAALESGKES